MKLQSAPSVRVIEYSDWFSAGHIVVNAVPAGKAMMSRSRMLPAVIGALLILSACAPGSPKASENPADTPPSPAGTFDVASAGAVKLVLWDQEVTPGVSTVIDELNKEFMAKYPNVTIERSTKNLADLKTTLKLALSGDQPPDVVQANQGYSDMAAFVEAGLLTPMGNYSARYGWDKRFPATQLALNSVSKDGKTLGTGDLYGISLSGEVVGIFYNKAKLADLKMKLPTTMEEFGKQLAEIKQAGEIPIQLGTSDKWSAIHVYGDIVGAQAGADAVSKLIFGQGGSFTDEPIVTAAQTLADWAKAGYFVDGYQGQTNDIAVENFGKGQGIYFIGGTWNQEPFAKALGHDVGFTVLPQSSGGKLASLGGIGLPFAIPAKSKNKDVAAAYIDFISSQEAMTKLAKNEQLPSVLPEDFTPKADTVAAEVWNTWKTINTDNGLIPYLDWTTLTMYDTITAQLQMLMAGQVDGKAFAQALQADNAKRG